MDLDHSYCKTKFYSESKVDGKNINKEVHDNKMEKNMEENFESYSSDDENECFFDYKDEDEKLIDLVRGYPCLYNKSLKEFKEREMKDTSWEEIAKILGSHPVAVKKKWDDLREKYSREKRLIEAETRSGSASSLRKKFPYFKNMAFIAPYMRKRQTISNFPTENKALEAMSSIENRRETSNIKPIDTKPSFGKRAKKVETDSKSEVLESSIISLSKVVQEHIANQNKNEKENKPSTSSNDSLTFLNYIASQMELLPTKKRLQVQTEISVLVNNAVLKEIKEKES